jgi:hypothetical protein
MASGLHFFPITATLLVLIVSPTSVCGAAKQGNPYRSPISPQAERPGNEPDVTTSQKRLRVLIPSSTQRADSIEINDTGDVFYASSFYEPVPGITDVLSHLTAAPPGSRPAWEESATLNEGSHQRLSTPPGLNDDARNRLLTYGASYAQQPYDTRLLLASISQEETSTLRLDLGIVTNPNPNSGLIAKAVPGTRIQTEEEFSPSAWMYSIALMAFVIYSRRRGSL